MELVKDSWIVKIKNDPEEQIKEVYKTEREFCLAWMNKNTNLSERDKTEIFQNAVVILYDNVMSGKLTTTTGKRSTYLISICRNIGRDYHRRYKKSTSEESFPILVDHINESQEEYDESERRFVKVSKIMDEMGPPCKTILEFFYYQKMTMEEISSQMKYKNIATAKNQKYKCLQRLRKQAVSN